MGTTHVTVKIPDEIYNDLMEIAENRYQGNRSMTIIEAIKEFIDENNQDFRKNIKSEMDEMKRDFLLLNDRVQKLDSSLSDIETQLSLIAQKYANTNS